jgi:2-polyprenyl-3-methyl-5-hydroxy-6-metoxy-1,4-benzoquinol methylase
MLRFKHRSTQLELLDGENIPFKDIAQNLKELNTINTLLGGHAITLDGVIHLAKIPTPTIVEIGCGGGDNLAFIQANCQRINLNPILIGIDLKKECIDFAQKKYPSIHFICSDFGAVELKNKPDIIFSSLFCHHFTNEELVEQLIWMKVNSNIGFFINDLHRNWMAYYAIKLLTALFSKSYLVKNDAPLSVARGFTRKEWKQLFEQSGISNFSIQWKWAFRHLILFKHGK